MLIKNGDIVIDNTLQEYVNNLYGKGASIALNGKEIGEEFNYNSIVTLPDGSVLYELSVSAKKIGVPVLSTNDDDATNLDIPPPKCQTNSLSNGEYVLTLPDGFLRYDDNNTYDCTIMQTNKNNYNDSNNSNNYGESHIVVANIFIESDELKYDTDLCEPYYITVDMNASILEDNINKISKDDESIFYPNCVFWNTTLNSFDDNNCYVHNYTNDTVICACNHLTTFNVKIRDIIPNVNKLDAWHFRNITFDNIIKYPTVIITILSFGLLSFILCLINPKSKHKNDIPSLAYDDIIVKDFKNEKFKGEQYAYEIDLLNKYIPNPHKLGNGILPLIKYDKHNFGNTDDVDEYPKCNLCWLQLRLYILYLGNDHTILSMFQRTSGSNFSTRQRISCFFMYVCTIMMANAIFFGIEQPFMGGITASFISSLISTIPVFIVRFIFSSSKPKIIERTLKLKDELLSKEMNSSQKSLNKKDYLDDLEKFRKKKQNTKIKYARRLMKKVIKNGNIRERYELVNEFRMIIFNQIYDFPYKCKYVGIIIMIAWTTFAIILAIVYGLSFDILYPYRPPTFYAIKYESSINIENTYPNCTRKSILNDMDTIASNNYADNIDSLTKEYLDKFSSFGINITDTQTWLTTLGLSLLISIFIWQPLTIYMLTWIKLWSFTLNLSLNTKPGTIKRICQRVCCRCFMNIQSSNDLPSMFRSMQSESQTPTGINFTPTSTNNNQILTYRDIISPQSNSVQLSPTIKENSSLMDNEYDFKWIDGKLFTERGSNKSLNNNNSNNKTGRLSRRGVVVTENRPMDILSFFSHDILFIKKDKIYDYNDVINQNIQQQREIEKLKHQLRLSIQSNNNDDNTHNNDDNINNDNITLNNHNINLNSNDNNTDINDNELEMINIDDMYHATQL